MEKHKFRVGDFVLFAGHFGQRRTPGEYEVMWLLPIESGQIQYRLRNKLERTERVAREEELSSRSGWARSE